MLFINHRMVTCTAMCTCDLGSVFCAYCLLMWSVVISGDKQINNYLHEAKMKSCTGKIMLMIKYSIFFVRKLKIKS